ncbi:hypothetical protein NDN94_07580 [Burkholderia glumae]|uniref:hypothetical protein n=1 Tax=Burkholderia glumae TaxID=337 RepID=UPI0020369F1C|nr:hypothetical protein [Burkholderia glumae]MCM2537687.1 hypothetical protein [Burkholderia glumae]
MDELRPATLADFALVINQLAKTVSELDAFRSGTLAALASLKASIQASPDFNATALEDAVTYFLALPPNTEHLDAWRAPLNVLREDRADLLKATRHHD